MINIKLPASSANIGIGFDSIALALDLYNKFGFEVSSNYKLIGFDESFDDSDNLIVKSYISFASSYLKEDEIKPVSITLIENQVPISRGLGSSSTCILAGVFAANEIHNLGKSFLECVSFSAKLEGHPDNVFACAYGGLVSVYEDNDNFYYKKYPVSSNLSFNILIPEIHGNTESLRNSLPESISYKDIVNNLSRFIQLPSAFASGNLDELKRILKDKLHEPYRFKFIPEFNEIKKLNEREDLIALISGSGPSILLIQDTLNKPLLSEDILKTFKLVQVSLGNQLEIEVV
jgi:homoserine kinase